MRSQECCSWHHIWTLGATVGAHKQSMCAGGRTQFLAQSLGCWCEYGICKGAYWPSQIWSQHYFWLVCCNTLQLFQLMALGLILWSKDLFYHSDFSFSFLEICSKLIADSLTKKGLWVWFLYRYSWVDDTTLVVCTIPELRGAAPKKPLIPAGPKIQSNEQKLLIQNRTYQDLLKDKHDEDLFDYYATTQLVLVSIDGEAQPIGPAAVYTSVDPSPDANFLLIESVHRPYSYIVPCGRFPKKVELWRRDGEFVKEICDLPLAEDIPIAFNSTRKGRRGIDWRSDKPSTLYW